MYYAKLRKVIIVSLFIVLGLALLFYAYYQSESFIKGPQITITKPEDGSSFEEPLIAIEGKAENISHISLNDRKIFVDENGLFSEKLLLLEGYNIITIKATDKFDRGVNETLELVLLGNNELTRDEQTEASSQGSGGATLPLGDVAEEGNLEESLEEVIDQKQDAN